VRGPRTDPPAILEYNLSLRDKTDQIPVLKRLAVIYQDQGQAEKAIRAWQQVIPLAAEDEEPIYELDSSLSRIRSGSRPGTFTRMPINAPRIRSSRSSSRSFNSNPKGQEKKRAMRQARRKPFYLPPRPSLSTSPPFSPAGRQCMPRQWISPTGNAGYTPIHEPFTVQVAKNHILGHYTIGIYQLRMDNTVNFIALTSTLPSRSRPGNHGPEDLGPTGPVSP